MWGCEPFRFHVNFQVVVSNMSYFHSYLGKIPILKSIFFKGVETHQLVTSNFQGGDLPSSVSLLAQMFFEVSDCFRVITRGKVYCWCRDVWDSN